MEEPEIKIGCDAVVNEVYALAALRYIGASGGDCRPALLTRGHEELLKAAVADQFAVMVAELLPDAADVDVAALRLTLQPQRVYVPGALTALRRSMEHVLALRVMAVAVPPAEAKEYAVEAAGAMVSLRVLLAGSVAKCRQHWI